MGHKRNEQGGFVVVIIMLQRVLLKLSTITVVLFVSFLENFFFGDRNCCKFEKRSWFFAIDGLVHGM